MTLKHTPLRSGGIDRVATPDLDLDLDLDLDRGVGASVASGE